jgi:hypothetical protein
MFTVFRSDEREIEFASMTFEKKGSEFEAYGVSIAWGLGGPEPVIFHGFQQLEVSTYPDFFYLVQVMDLGDDGTLELLLKYDNGYGYGVEIWQGSGTEFKRLGLVWY